MYRDVLSSGSWNQDVPLYTEVSSFQEVRIDGLHCASGCIICML